MLLKSPKNNNYYITRYFCNALFPTLLTVLVQEIFKTCIYMPEDTVIASSKSDGLRVQTDNI